MGMFDWFFGKKTTVADRQPATEQPAAACCQAAAAPPSEADNLRRWREAGHARAWVEARGGQWDHAAWLALLDDLQHSAFWPMPPDAVGQTLEEAKREWLRRN